jgi:hypothetical protein
MKLPRRNFLHLARRGGELRGRAMRKLTTIAALVGGAGHAGGGAVASCGAGSADACLL